MAHGDARTYSVYGLRIDSDVPLPLPATVGADAIDLVVRRGPPLDVPDHPPNGEIKSADAVGDRRSWLVQDGEGHLIRFSERCEFRLASDNRTIRVHPDWRMDAGLLPDVLLRNVLIQVLRLRGSCVLHASAVHVQGTTLAFGGPGGAGKSTLAGQFCAIGATLITDDVLRVDFDEDTARCFLGPPLLRLRPGGSELAESLASGSSASVEDERVEVSPPQPISEPLALDVLLVPVLSAEAGRVRVERLRLPAALAALGTASGRRSATGAEMVRAFQDHASLVERVPVLRVEIPLGPLPDAALAWKLLELLDHSC